MSSTNTIARPNACDEDELDSRTLENCEAMIVCLNTRRFVIVRPGEAINVWPCDRGWDDIRNLHPGDKVIYKGTTTQVSAVEVYR
ncbi:hypothetical protein [Rubripirellula reticaptiva]|uniref:Uncharacterized protein n=1 Tax=Rubripirellula reticaptiva TaxID=2528013 RepID=A0A5C6EKG7_9BACT|nr:hypothetical protein [Rubripirellula reticaptiva]TWU49602.1 hypothetical protein Poly59_42190 [Rubripirellula reticaptiva]